MCVCGCVCVGGGSEDVHERVSVCVRGCACVTV